jgi:uncharacterized protein YndB with AHSA1/START domain
MSGARALTDGETVFATIDVAVSPRRAFEAMNSAEVERWWGAPSLYRMQGWQADRRVGGSWRVDVRLPNGTLLPADGEYLVVEAPHLVALTRRYDWDHPTLGRRVTKVIYGFDEIERGTCVTVLQGGFGSSEAAREHAAGWERTLNLLRAHLVPGATLGAEAA